MNKKMGSIWTYLYVFTTLFSVCMGQSSTPFPGCVPHNAHIRSWRKEDFPNPQLNISKCGRNCKSSWVCDPGHTLTTEGGDYLDDLIYKVQSSGQCPCPQCTSDDGYNVSVALVPSMNEYHHHNTDPAKTFASYLKNKWNFQKCDNDIVIFISRDNRKVATVAGKTANKILTSKCIDEVYNKVKQTLKAAKYQDGLESMIRNYRSILSKGGCEAEPEDEPNVAVIVIAVFGSVFFLGLLCQICICICKGGDQFNINCFGFGCYSESGYGESGWEF